MLSLSRLRLLVAEDHPDWQNIIADLLEDGCDLVGTVERGDQILEAAQQFRPDLITLDISMPGQSGLMVLPRLRAAFPMTIIIIVSSRATELYVEEAFGRGADGYVEKSRVCSDLIKTVASAQHRLRSNDQTGAIMADPESLSGILEPMTWQRRVEK